jgi:hypothetical protein
MFGTAAGDLWPCGKTQPRGYVVLMFVSADRALGVSLGTAQLRLANLVRDESLRQVSHSAYRGGMDHLLRVGPVGELAGASRLVRIELLDPVYRDDAMTVGMRWETIGVTGGLFPVLDADISLSAERGQAARLALHGCYRPPFGALGAGLDKMVMHTVAELTMRSLLTSIAAFLEGPVLAEGRGQPACSREAGPRVAPG